MTIFKIQFTYKEKNIEASVHELETPPKQWHVTVEDEQLPKECHGTYIVFYDYHTERYKWGYPKFDSDHSFMSSLGVSLKDHLLEHGWDSINH